MSLNFKTYSMLISHAHVVSEGQNGSILHIDPNKAIAHVDYQTMKIFCPEHFWISASHLIWQQLRIQGRGQGGHATLSLLKVTELLRDGRHLGWLIFHVSSPPPHPHPSDNPGSDAGQTEFRIAYHSIKCHFRATFLKYWLHLIALPS